MNLNSAALHQKRFFQNSLMMNDRCRFLFALVLGICINVILLFAGELFLQFSKQDFQESAKTVSVIHLVLEKSIQETISSSQIIQDEKNLEEEQTILSNQIIEEEIFLAQQNIGKVSESFVNQENNVINSSGNDFDENVFSESSNSSEIIAANTFSSSSVFSAETEKNNLYEIIYSLIEKEKEYPALARRRNIEGQVDVTIIITTDGKLEDSDISSSSGSPILDQAAINLLKTIFPLNIFLHSETTVTITINYLLED